MMCLQKIKNLIFLSGILLCLSFAPNRSAGKGIQFFKGSFSEALAESRKAGKPVFIDIYASWCGPCRLLKHNTFKDAAVGEYYNKNFICVSIDGETDEGTGLRKLYDVRSYPTLLITDSSGKLLTKTEGFMKPYILVSFGRRIIP